MSEISNYNHYKHVLLASAYKKYIRNPVKKRDDLQKMYMISMQHILRETRSISNNKLQKIREAIAFINANKKLQKNTLTYRYSNPYHKPAYNRAASSIQKALKNRKQRNIKSVLTLARKTGNRGQELGPFLLQRIHKFIR